MAERQPLVDLALGVVPTVLEVVLAPGSAGSTWRLRSRAGMVVSRPSTTNAWSTLSVKV